MSASQLVPPGDGDESWAGEVLLTRRIDLARPDAPTVVELELPAGFHVTEHTHRDGDVLLYVLDGEVAFRCDGLDRTFTRGGVAWFPRRRAHTMCVSGDGPARLLAMITGTASCVAPLDGAFSGHAVQAGSSGGTRTPS